MLLSQEITDTERMEWLERKMEQRRVLFSRSRSTGLCSLHEVSGDTRGTHTVRAAIDTEMYLERREAVGLQRRKRS